MGHHWELLRSLLPLYQAMTTVQIGDGRGTLFWTDVWAGEDSLAERFPRLYTHCTSQDISVYQAVHTNLQGAFVNRLTPEAQLELSQLNGIVDSIQLTDQPDTRLSPFSKTSDKLDTSTIYRLLKTKKQTDCQSSNFIWKNAAPPRVQMFIWLLIRGRIQCQANLYRIVDSPCCTLCPNTDETPDHIIFGCPFAGQFWNALGFQDVAELDTGQLHTFQHKPGALAYPRISSVHSSLCVAGSCGSEEMEWFSEMSR